MLRVASAKVSATGRVVAMKPFIRRSSVGGSQLLRSISKYSTSGSVKAFIPQASSLGLDKTVENNAKTDTNRLAKTLTKFWEKVDTHYDATKDLYEVQLDGKTLKTPLGFPLALPSSKKQLAYLIANEWANLPDLKIKTNMMPLTSIAARSIDLINIHEKEAGSEKNEMIAKVGDLDDIKFNMLRYLDTDTCLIFTTRDEYRGTLRKRQDELYLPLIAEFEDFFTIFAHNKGLLPSEEAEIKLEYLDCETDGIRGNKQSITTQNVVLQWLHLLPIYDLIALEKAILTSKSFLCGVTLLRSNAAQSDPKLMKEVYQLNRDYVGDYYHKTVEEIVELGNMETIFQTREWGEVEDTHDVDKVDWLRNLTSAALLCH
ncbi:hypothetical protein G9P44_003372 [Scheffersomyces stipitis]|nr:hypothetical protein G9P44_003372 [Scheffersomyces stipitis]